MFHILNDDVLFPKKSQIFTDVFNQPHKRKIIIYSLLQNISASVVFYMIQILLSTISFFLDQMTQRFLHMKLSILLTTLLSL